MHLSYVKLINTTSLIKTENQNLLHSPRLITTGCSTILMQLFFMQRIYSVISVNKPF